MTATPPAGNRLGRETSPYLLQHKDNPVHWMPWGPDAFAKARAENKPILLSIGYAACHWCHVMAHESFENPDIAALMNDLYVNIKVDREERPDLDQIYQQALALLGQHGGWPLTMFLTPDGEPFWGGTYFPPESRWGRPGFPDVLRGVAATYAKEPDKVSRNVTALKDALGQLSESHAGGTIEPAILDQVAERLVQQVDTLNGGIGQAPKFPQTTIFELLWRAWRRTAGMPYRTAVTTTLTRMCQGGIYDHLGGGFARYATDEAWLIPHFEKMLYDNALLVELLTRVWQGTGERLYEMRVRETVDWVLRDMVAQGADGLPADGFASSLDADSEGEEGRFYVWTEAEIDKLLGQDSPLFKQAYDVTADGNWEGKTILNRLHRPDLADDDTEGRLAELRQVLWLARGQRVRPGWDDKVLADWNGLMIRALARAGFAFAEPAWIAAADRAFDFIAGILSEDGRLYHSWRRGTPRHIGTLDDYASMADAALALYEVTGRLHYIDHAARWVDVLDEHYWDAEAGGYFFTADDAEHLLVRTKSAADNATPSGNGTLVGVLARLYFLTGEARFRNRAGDLATAFSGELQRNFFPLATLLNNVELLQSARQVVIVGDPDRDDMQALLAVLRSNYLPDAILSLVSPDSRLPAGHPAHGKGMVDGKATAYVCADMTCLAPVTDPQSLLSVLTDH